MTPSLLQVVYLALVHLRDERTLRRNGLAEPAWLDEAIAELREAINHDRRRPETTELAEAGSGADTDRVSCSTGTAITAWSIEETAQALGCSSRTVQRFLASGRLPALHAGRLVRIDREVVPSYTR